MKSAVVWLALGIVGSLTTAATAECCHKCGCHCQCSKVCRCVPEVKKVPKITYGCECEDFCVPGKSKVCGHKCSTCEGECHCGLWKHLHREPIWQPTCAQVRTRTKLVKHEEMKEVCGWKWEVVDLCPRCAAHKDTQVDARQHGAPPADDYNAGADVLMPVVDPSSSDKSAQLASHSSAGKIKRMLLPMLDK